MVIFFGMDGMVFSMLSMVSMVLCTDEYLNIVNISDRRYLNCSTITTKGAKRLPKTHLNMRQN